MTASQPVKKLSMFCATGRITTVYIHSRQWIRSGPNEFSASPPLPYLYHTNYKKKTICWLLIGKLLGINMVQKLFLCRTIFLPKIQALWDVWWAVPCAMHRKTGILNNIPSSNPSLASSACKNDTSHHSISHYKALRYNTYKPFSSRSVRIQYTYCNTDYHIPAPTINAIVCYSL